MRRTTWWTRSCESWGQRSRGEEDRVATFGCDLLASWDIVMLKERRTLERRVIQSVKASGLTPDGRLPLTQTMSN